MKILDVVADAIWTRLEPFLDKHLAAMRADVNRELDEWQVIAQQQLDAWRADAMAMLSEALPEMAGAVAREAVKTTFEHTQVDEAADAVSGVIADIVNRLRIPFLGPHK